MTRPVDEAPVVGIFAAHARHNRTDQEPVDGATCGCRTDLDTPVGHEDHTCGRRCPTCEATTVAIEEVEQR